jgi:hypothetical protein
MQVVENGSRTGRALEVLWRVFANVYNSLQNTRMDLRVGCVMGSRVREQDLQIVGRSFSQAL